MRPDRGSSRKGASDWCSLEQAGRLFVNHCLMQTRFESPSLRFGALIILLFVGGLGHLFAEPAEDAKLAATFKAYLDEHFELEPMAATELGDHRFDARLEDLTPAARAKWLELTRRILAELPQRVDYQKLSRAGQIDFEMVQIGRAACRE